MKYDNIKKGTFVSRIDRFTALTDLGLCHVKNTGRLKEILIPNTEIYVQETTNPLRKTKYDLIAAYKQDRLINIDSIAPNKVIKENINTLFTQVNHFKHESYFKNSRFDFYIETAKEKIYLEVKGVTQEFDGVAMFPDAPTQRGLKHINELIECTEHGYTAYIIFVIQMKCVKYFTPNSVIHKDFSEALNLAYKKKVNIIAFDCNVQPDSLTLGDRVELILPSP